MNYVIPFEAELINRIGIVVGHSEATNITCVNVSIFDYI